MIRVLFLTRCLDMRARSGSSLTGARDEQEAFHYHGSRLLCGWSNLSCKGIKVPLWKRGIQGDFRRLF